MAEDTTEPTVDVVALQKENERLREELKRLHTGMQFSTMASGAGLASTVAGQSTGTVMGIEEMILQVSPDRTIGYINAPMARLLGVDNRRSMLGEPLANWDDGSLGQGTLLSVVDAAAATSDTVVIERVCVGMDESVLPNRGERPNSDPILRFVANAVKGRVEVVAQDVTRLRWLENTFARYVAPEVIEQMLMRPQENFMEMERRELTALFVDLRGFTRITQQLQPTVLQEMINEFLSNMVDCINRYDGTVDKFVGDEVMALFGAPISMGDHGLRGLLAAVEMQKSHNRMIEAWREQDRPSAGIGIGVTTGEVFVGNIGTPARMDYTALGHYINLAARLCGSAEAGEILTIGQTYHHAAEAMKTTRLEPIPRFKFSPQGKRSFKNVDEPVSVLSVSVT